ncbi:TMAO reductase system sensor histidine kinase/response regulator TorS [Vibrio sinaloensis]|uniref:TMAO reductase system sensor histidine kinase/response regulator TorS n=1 Tax=Photobacterium sp. (strain ATCC 43367) TaxID=379097 RepID=UPI00206D77F0|nr:TMAO reductase system sensor histidine kinase/response regulator TorS [Vibrio sinaloensis]UPQ89931.1 TMAO reductase system sensor histidine kinase/response regulator TorS [Vibrio sinaloensis]
MLLAKASIGRKLLLAFLAMALLVLTSAVIGVSGFSLVAKTERNVVNSAIPSMLEARQVSELSSRIISSVQTLSNAKTEVQRQQAGKELFTQLESLLAHIKLLGSDAFDGELLNRLENDVQRVIDTLAQLGIAVEQRLILNQKLALQTEALRQLAQELEQLTRTQVANTSTIAVANVTHIYTLLEQQNLSQAYQALDTLVEVDLDLAERLHEFHLLAFKQLNYIEESRTVSDIDRIRTLRDEFNQNLTIMNRRVHAVEDPTRSKQMVELLQQLKQRVDVFEILENRDQNERDAQQLMQNTLTQFSALNATVSKLVDESNLSTTRAVEALKSTLDYAQLTLTIITLLGMIIAVLIIWKVVYVSVVKRLAEYSSALMSIAKGQLQVEINAQGNDELAQMGQAIITAQNTAKVLKVVAESETKAKRELQEHKEHLEELVAERTLQLSQANQRLNEEVTNHAEARANAEQASRAKTAFLATMSHEIRTPMNGVLGTARLLKDTGLNRQQSRYVDVINRSGNNLLAILNDVLDYSKIEAGHLEIRPVNFNLHAMVDDTMQLMTAKAQEKALELSCVIESDVDRFWLGDATRISQVLNNLVGNAIKFTDTGHIDLYVANDSERPGWVCFEVSDSGIGIDPAALPNLFDAFTQAGPTQACKGGTGLGLAISKRIVDAMGGEIEVESELREGSRFWFCVPLAKGESVEQIETVSDSNIKARVLLVEDNPINCMVAEGFLASLGHEVVTAVDGAQAKEVFTSQAFDIALLDINLPDCNGVELLHELKQCAQQQQLNQGIPLIAVSAHVYDEEVASYLSAGFDGYLPKPLDKEALCHLIQQRLESSPLVQYSVSYSAQSPAADGGIIDPAVILADLEVLGADKINAIVTLFEQGVQQSLTELEQAYEQNDAEEIKQLTHKIKGSAGSLGLGALHEVCLSIEQSSQPLSAYSTQRITLQESVAAAQHALNTLIKRETE